MPSTDPNSTVLTPGPDTYSGTAGSENIDGAEGDDYLQGNGGDDILYGSEGDDQLFGGTGHNTLHGGEGNDWLRPLGGDDLLDGGPGDDTYFLIMGESKGELIEAAGNGNDRVLLWVDVMSSDTYTLPAGVEIETLSFLIPNHLYASDNFYLIGNEFNNTIIGSEGKEIMYGGGGKDTFIGGLGDDEYHVDSQDDQIIEGANAGMDRVFTTVDYTLPAGQEIEELWSYAPGDLRLTGNEFNNTLKGGAGAAILDGGPGADDMFSNTGDDVFLVDNAGDRVHGFPGPLNQERVYASVSFALLPGSFVDTLSTDNDAGTAPINLTGDDTPNTLIGNAGPNMLDGGAGDDVLRGLGGNDFLNGGTGTDSAGFSGARIEYDIRTFAVGGVLQTVIAHQGGAQTDGTDALAGVETLQFSDHGFALARAQLNHTSNVDGDRFDDVLFQNVTTGQVYFAKMVGGAFQSWGVDTGALSTDWKAIGSGDVNPGPTGGAETFVQQQSTGTIQYASLDSGSTTLTTVDAAPGLDWKLRAVGDMNGDATADAVLQNTTTGAIKYAAMFNGTSQGYDLVTDSLSTNWSLIGVGDINQNGRADAVVQNQSTGTIYYVGVANGVQSWGVVSNSLTTDWQAKAVADVTGDGFADVIVQQASTGTTYFADMHNGVFDHWGVVTANVTADWVVQGTADVDNDGFAGVLFQNLAGGSGVNPGTTYYANMGPAGFEGWGAVASNISADWHVV